MREREPGSPPQSTSPSSPSVIGSTTTPSYSACTNCYVDVRPAVSDCTTSLFPTGPFRRPLHLSDFSHCPYERAATLSSKPSRTGFLPQTGGYSLVKSTFPDVGRGETPSSRDTNSTLSALSATAPKFSFNQKQQTERRARRAKSSSGTASHVSNSDEVEGSLYLSQTNRVGCVSRFGLR